MNNTKHYRILRDSEVRQLEDGRELTFVQFPRATILAMCKEYTLALKSLRSDYEYSCIAVIESGQTQYPILFDGKIKTYLQNKLYKTSKKLVTLVLHGV